MYVAVILDSIFDLILLTFYHLSVKYGPQPNSLTKNHVSMPNSSEVRTHIRPSKYNTLHQHFSIKLIYDYYGDL